jgi:hypothetical protein
MVKVTRESLIYSKPRAILVDWTLVMSKTREEQAQELAQEQGVPLEQARIWVDLQAPAANEDLLEERYAAILAKCIADEIDRDVLNSIQNGRPKISQPLS